MSIKKAEPSVPIVEITSDSDCLHDRSSPRRARGCVDDHNNNSRATCRPDVAFPTSSRYRINKLQCSVIVQDTTAEA